MVMLLWNLLFSLVSLMGLPRALHCMLRRACVIPCPTRPRELDPQSMAQVVRFACSVDVSPSAEFTRLACAKAVLRVHTLPLRTVADHILLLAKHNIRTEKAAVSFLLRRATALIETAGPEDIRSLLWSCRRLSCGTTAFLTAVTERVSQSTVRSEVSFAQVACMAHSLTQLGGTKYHALIYELVTNVIESSSGQGSRSPSAMQYAAMIIAVIDVDGRTDLNHRLLEMMAAAPDASFGCFAFIIKGLGRSPLVSESFLQTLMSECMAHIASGSLQDTIAVLQILESLPTLGTLTHTRLFIAMVVRRIPTLLPGAPLAEVIAVFSSLSRLRVLDRTASDSILSECDGRAHSEWDATAITEFLNVALHHSPTLIPAVQTVIGMIDVTVPVSTFTAHQLYLTMKGFGKLLQGAPTTAVDSVLSQCIVKASQFNAHLVCGVLLSCGNLQLDATAVGPLVGNLALMVPSLTPANVASAIHAFHRCQILKLPDSRKIFEALVDRALLDPEEGLYMTCDQIVSILCGMAYGRYCPHPVAASRLVRRVVQVPPKDGGHVRAVLELVDVFPSVAECLETDDVAAILMCARSHVESMTAPTGLAAIGLMRSNGVVEKDLLAELVALETKFVGSFDENELQTWKAWMEVCKRWKTANCESGMF